jgi:DNA repair exonuclease SbcCD ATPase subunit
MNIYEIKTENFKKLTAVQLTLDGKGVIITGKNGVGKSSLIDALFTTLTGKDLPTDPIQKGKDSARNIVKIKKDDGAIITVEKVFKKNTTTLIVKTESGQKYPSPQKFLNDTIGNITFDPFEFIELAPIEQKRFLMKLLGLDFTEIDNRKRKLLDEKDEIFKDEIRIQKSIDKIPIHNFGSTGAAKKDASDILKRQKEINDIQNGKDAIKSKVELIYKENENHSKEIDKLKTDQGNNRTSIQNSYDGIAQTESDCSNYLQNVEEKIKQLKKEAEEYKTKSEQKIKDIKSDITVFENNIKLKENEISNFVNLQEENTAKINSLLDEFNKITVPEFNGDALLKEIEEHNALVDTENTRQGLISELKEVESNKREKLDAINDIEKEKIQLINSVKMPVDGLAFTDEGLSYEGMELTEEQISKAKLIEIGVKIQMALNPTLRIMRIKDGSLLDSEMLDIIRKACKENDYQLFIEKVSDDKEIGFLIEEDTE